MSALAEALRYAARGKPIFPCSQDKKPRTERGFHDATTDEATIQEWWRRWPDSLIGLPTGSASGLVVIDIDIKRGVDGGDGLFELQQQHGRLPGTAESLTPSGGRHLYFKYPAHSEIKNSAGKLAPGLDIRGEGGYVIAPGSVNGIGRYEWEASSTQVAKLPPAWIELLAAPPKTEQPRVERKIAEGGRNNHLASLAGSMRRRGMSPEAITTALIAENGASCSPPLPDNEVYQIAASVARYAPAETAPRRREAPTDSSEDGLALAFVAQHAETLRWVELWHSWLQWDGMVWRKDEVLSVWDEVRAMCRETGKESMRKAATVAAVERLARSDQRVAATVEQWDSDPWLLNTPAGIIDLKSGRTAPHDPMKFCRKLTAESAGDACPRWEKFLTEVTDGDDDLKAYLQRVAGYCLTGSTREHALFFIYGTGGNGKGVYLNTLTRLFGDYARTAAMETFTESFGERHSTDLAMLQGARLVVAQETEEGKRWAESRIKALTGGDRITARFMRQDFFEFDPQFKLLVAGNHKPHLRNVDEAIRRRLQIIPFTVTVPPESRDPDLEERLRAEWPGILRWALRGCLEWQKDGLRPPEAVKAATADYFETQDALLAWLEECCDTGPRYWETPTKLFESWKGWCEHANEHPGKQRGFGDRLEQHGFYRERKMDGRRHVGLRVK